MDARTPKILTFGRIAGGNRFNILADKVTLEGSLRYLQEATRTEMLNGLRHLLEGLARTTGRGNRSEGHPHLPSLKE